MHHPCQECGACCAYFRVSFYWREAETFPQCTPPLYEEQDHLKRVMSGTNRKRSIRCAALEGKIGEQVSCKIYSSRPSPCRAFSASYENGEAKPRCDEARAAFGLQPLRPSDWERFRKDFAQNSASETRLFEP